MSRTENDIFDAYKQEHGEDGVRWREWWRRYWMDQIADYFERKWWLVPCGKYSKRPIAGFEWSRKRLSFEETVWFAAQGLNIAVVAEDLVILDVDSDAKKPYDTGTLTMKTPKGYQYWCSGPFDHGRTSLLRKLGFDVPRSGIMFSLVPLSRTCRNDKGGKCFCLVHDFRFREWVNFGAECLPFRKVVRELI